MKSTRRMRAGKAALFCAVASAVGLLFCSQCSPFYPINVWGDANCLLTVGRVMREGGVLYRDIYEQKGPTLYLLHALAACISDRSFLGVYLLEIVAWGAALFSAWRIAERKDSEPVIPTLPFVALMAACVLTGAAFSRGDSAEEFCLPLFVWTMDIALAEYGRAQGPMRPSRLMACGLMAGLVATIKYTLLGLYIGLCVCEGVAAWKEGGLARAVKHAGAFLCGMLMPVLAWAVYFAAQGALGDAVQAYLIHNIFLYGAGEEMTWREALRLLRDNALWAVPAAAGLAAFCLYRDKTPAAKLCVLAMAGGQMITVFLLGRVWPYSPMAMAPFAVLAVPAARRAAGAVIRLGRGNRRQTTPRRTAAGPVRGAASAGICLLAAAVAWQMTPNAFLRGQKLDDLAQGRLAGYIEEGATLLQYNHLDDGLYLTSGALPQQKYFVRLNVALDEMDQELDRYVREGIPDYVLVTWNELPQEFDRYERIAEDAGYDDSNRINKMFYLYRRKSE